MSIYTAESLAWVRFFVQPEILRPLDELCFQPLCFPLSPFNSGSFLIDRTRAAKIFKSVQSTLSWESDRATLTEVYTFLGQAPCHTTVLQGSEEGIAFLRRCPRAKNICYLGLRQVSTRERCVLFLFLIL